MSNPVFPELDSEVDKITDINILKNIYKECLIGQAELEIFIEQRAATVLPPEQIEGIGTMEIVTNLIRKIRMLETKNKEVVENCVCKRDYNN